MTCNVSEYIFTFDQVSRETRIISRSGSSIGSNPNILFYPFLDTCFEDHGRYLKVVLTNSDRRSAWHFKRCTEDYYVWFSYIMGWAINKQTKCTVSHSFSIRAFDGCSLTLGNICVSSDQDLFIELYRVVESRKAWELRAVLTRPRRAAQVELICC